MVKGVFMNSFGEVPQDFVGGTYLLGSLAMVKVLYAKQEGSRNVQKTLSPPKI